MAVSKNFTMLAPSFLDVATGTLSTDQIACDQAVKAYNADFTDLVEGWTDDAAVIQVPNGVGGYEWRYFISDAYDEASGDFVQGWAGDDTLLSTKQIDLGVGVWLRGKKDTVTKFTFSGAVSDNASETVSRETPIKFELVANPYPTELNVNSNKVTWDIAPVKAYNADYTDLVDGWTEEAAVIQVPNGVGGYEWRYYISDAYDEASGDFVQGWASDDTLLKDITVPAATAFWVRRCSQDGKDTAWSFTLSL